MKIKLAGQVLVATITSVILVVMVASPLAAEEPIDNSEYIYCCQDNQPGWRRTRYLRNNYALGKSEILNGQVVSVDRYTFRRGSSEGIHLLVSTGTETVEVHLAPSWYLEEQNFDIAPEDEIAITGSRINLDGEEAIVARKIKKGNETLFLRDENGFPLWRRHGWKR